MLNQGPSDGSIQEDRIQHSVQEGAEPGSQVITESTECIPPWGTATHPSLGHPAAIPLRGMQRGLVLLQQGEERGIVKSSEQLCLRIPSDFTSLSDGS